MKRLALLDRCGRQLSPCQLPPLLLIEFADWLEILRGYPGNATTQYHLSPIYRAICDRCLQLHCIDPDSLHPDQIPTFVLDDLVRLNQSEDAAKDGEETISFEAWAYSLTAAIALQSGVTAAIDLCETQPADRLAAILKAMARLSSGKGDDVPLDSPVYQELIEENMKGLFGHVDYTHESG